MQRINMKTSWIPAEEALARLGTKPQTLYANVSRGRIRAKPDPADPRRSLYQASDVDQLAERQGGRRKAIAVAADTMRWGDPVLPTSISAIVDGRLFYRGRDALDLARHTALEDVAALLWQSDRGTLDLGAGTTSGENRLSCALGMLAERVMRDLPAMGRGNAALRTDALEVLTTVAAALAPWERAAPLHKRLALGWGCPQAAEPLRIALVVAAEHELNVSAFAARVTASSGAALSAAALSGLATLTGPRHGGAWISVSRLVERAEQAGTRTAIRDMLSAEGVVRAFGHRLYPEGDPRAKAIMNSLELPPIYSELAVAGEELLGEPANIDFALASLAAAYALPQDAPLVVFALSRTVGWLAHAMEQAASGQMIRPRASYEQADGEGGGEVR
jgi:citrate synthase